MDVEIIHVKSIDKLDDFYKDWDLVFEGVILKEAPLYLDFLKQYTKVKNKIYTFKGKMLNDKYHLTGDNRYPDDLTFMIVKLEDIEDVGKIALSRFEIGGRWFTDIVDNNARREEEKIRIKENAEIFAKNNNVYLGDLYLENDDEKYYVALYKKTGVDDSGLPMFIKYKDGEFSLITGHDSFKVMNLKKHKKCG